MISKYEKLDRFVFQSNALNSLAQGTFTSSNIEVLELFDRKMRFSITRKRKHFQYYFDVVFSTKAEAQQFFNDLRLKLDEVNFCCSHLVDIRLTKISSYIFVTDI